LSILTYAQFTGLAYFATEAWHILVLRFVGALGMGGEWSLGVALVNEVWPGRSRAFLAGLIGAAANVGFILIAIFGLFVPTAQDSWRTLMLIGALPALLTFFVIVYVPESESWLREKDRGGTTHWATRDLAGVLVGAAGACLVLVLWANELSLVLQITGSLLGLTVALLGFLYPVLRYLQRATSAAGNEHSARPIILRMLLGAGLSGVALIGTWGSIQFAPSWADQISKSAAVARYSDTSTMARANGAEWPHAKEWTQITLGIGAVLGTILAALMGDWLGRRWTYALLCIGSLFTVWLFFWTNEFFGIWFLATAFLAGGVTAAFYGWFPLYLPELFRTAVRATGQGFSYNFGRILAAAGALQAGVLVREVFAGSYAKAASVIGLVYLVGLVLIWLAPETRGKPLPE
jgi:MFS family permease